MSKLKSVTHFRCNKLLYFCKTLLKMSFVLIVLSLIALIVVPIYLFVKNTFSYWKLKGIPFLKPKFPFGNFHMAFMQKLSFTDLVQVLYNSTNGPYIGVYIFFMPSLLVRDPKLIQTIVLEEFPSFFQSENFENETIRLRKLSATLTQLKGIFGEIAKSGSRLVEYIEQFAQPDETVEIHNIFKRFIVNWKYRKNKNIDLTDFSRLLRLRNTDIETDADDNGGSTNLLNYNKKMSLDEVAAEAHILLVGSFEPISATAAFCMYELAKAQDIQQKAFQEIQTVLREHNGRVTYESIAAMKFIENCVDGKRHYCHICLMKHPNRVFN